MQIVFVRARAGRLAFLDTLCAKQIPHDRAIRTVMTPHLSRLINVHGDVELVADPSSPAQEVVEAPVARLRGRPRKQGASNGA